MRFTSKRRYSTGRGGTGVFLVLCLIGLCTAGETLGGEPPFTLVFSGMETRNVGTDDERYIAGIIEELLLESMKDSFKEIAGRYVEVRRIEKPPPPDAPHIKEWARAARAEGTHYYLAAELILLEVGYVLQMETVSLLDAEQDNWSWSGERQIAIISGREPDLAAIERQIRTLSGRTAEIMARGPVKKVLCWCIKPFDPEDRELVFISRRLTLDLPYFLKNKQKGFRFIGLQAREYVGECSEGREFNAQQVVGPFRRPLEQYDYVISGEVGLTEERHLWADLSVGGREEDGIIPLVYFKYTQRVELGKFDVRTLSEELASRVVERWIEVISLQ